MALLILLVEQKFAVVSRTEILKALWPSVVVGEEVISQLVYSLRNALGDDAKNPIYIETIPKKGYRFIADVHLMQSVDDNFRTVNKSSEISKKSVNPVKYTAAIIGVALTVFIGFFALIGAKKSDHFAVENILPVTQSKGVEADFTINSKTKEMIYVYEADGRTELFKRSLDANQSYKLTDNNWKESSPVWINNQEILYIRQNGHDYQIVKHVLLDKPEVLYETNNHLYGLSVSPHRPNDVIFTEYDDYRHNRFNELKSLSLASGNVEFLHNKYLDLPKESYHVSYSLDGDTLFFVDHSKRSNRIVALHLQSNRIEAINSHFNGIEDIFQVDKNTLLIAGTYAATKGIWSIGFAGELPELILPMSAGYKVMQAQLHKKNIYYTTYKAPINLSVSDKGDADIDILPLVNSEASELSASFSPDGNVLYFASNRTGYYELWKYHFNSERLVQITQLNAAMIHRPILSKDRSKIAVVYEKGSLMLGILCAESGKVLNEMQIPSMKYPLAWSEDGDNLYVSEHKRQINIYRYDASTLQPTLIQKRAGLYARESIDGQFLTFLDYKYLGLISKDLKTGEEIKLSHMENLDFLVPGQLVVVDNSIVRSNYVQGQTYLYQYPLMKGEYPPVRLDFANLPASSSITDISKNGEKVVFTKQTPSQGNIMVASIQ
jgi:DNA-binding winged helix-turn-helix (wHTH) protein/Tol biopolymer transport system component